MPALASRLENAQQVDGTRCGISGFRTGWQGPAANGALAIGDHCAIVPPFAGHGLSIAILAALEAAPRVAAWSRGEIPWPEVVATVKQALRRNFQSRLRWSRWLHTLLLHPAGQIPLDLLASGRLLPWHWLYQKMR